MAGFGSNDILEIVLDLDAQDAEATARKLGGEIDNVEKSAGKARKGFDGILAPIKETIVRLGIWGKLIDGAKTAISTFAGGLQKVSEFVGQIHAQFDKLATARMFNVTIEDADKLRGILTDVKSRMEALALGTEMRQLGLTQEETQRFAHLINVLAAVTGETKAALEARLKSAQLTDRELGALTKLTGQLKTQQGLQVQMLKAQVQAGGRTLDQGERIREMLQFTQASRQMEVSLGELGKANPFDDLVKEAKTLWEDITQLLTPAIRASAQALASLGQVGVRTLRVMAANFKELKDSINAWLISNATRDKEMEKLTDSLLAGHKSVEEAVKAHAALAKRQADAAAKLRRDEETARKRLLQEQQEALQEQMSRLASARALLRNFERSALAAIATQGAAGIGPIIGGMSQAIEMARQFTALMGPDFQRKSSQAALLFQSVMDAGKGGLEAMIAGEKQRTNNLRVALLVSQSAIKEQQVLNEVLNKRKTLDEANLAINRALGVLMQSQSGVAKTMITRLTRLKKVMEQQGQEQLRLLNLQRQRVAIQERAQLRDQALQFAQQEIALSEDLRKKRAEIAQLEGFIVRDRGEAAQVAMRQAQIEAQRIQNRIQLLQQESARALVSKDRQILTTKIQQEQKLLSVTKERINLLATEWLARSQAAQLQAEQFRLEQARTALTRAGEQAAIRQQIAQQRAALAGTTPIAGLDQLQQIRRQIQEAQLAAASLQRQLRRVAPGSEQAQQFQQELNHRLQMVALMREQLNVTKEQVAQEKERRTAFGAFVAQAKAQVADLAQKTGQQLWQAFQGFTSGIGSTIAGAFEAMTSGASDVGAVVGKGFLDALSGMAAQLGAFFLAAGTAQMFVPPYTGAGAVAGGLALLALSGALKGASSLISTQPTTPRTSSTGSSSAVPRFQSQVPGQRDPRTERPVNIYVSMNSEPWDRRSDTERFKGLRDWIQRNQRATGLPLPTGGGRRG